MRILYILFFIVISLFSFDKEGCINTNGLFIEGKCLIDGRAICLNVGINQNITYGYVNIIPDFAKDYVEKGIFDVNNTIYTAKIIGECRYLTDVEIALSGIIKLLNTKIYNKEGAFIHYGDTPFEWAYIPKSGNFIGFLKQSDTGFLDYVVVDTELNNLIIDQNDTSIIIKNKD